MGGIGGPELFLILVVVLLVFGPKKIPEVARGLGKGLREFRKLSTDFQREINLSAALEEEDKRAGGRPGAAKSPGPPASKAALPDGGADPSPPAPDSGADSSPPVPEEPVESSDSRKASDEQ